MTPSRPYLIRAIYEWILDNGMAPHLLVNAQIAGVNVPPQYVQNGKIILNVSPSAVHNLDIGNERVEFSARFGGVAMYLVVPVAAVLAIYAKENGQGMVFNDSEGGGTPPKPATDKSNRPKLKLVT